MSSILQPSRNSVDTAYEVAPPGQTAGAAHLLWLVRRIAIEDHDAFADLYDALSVQLLDELRSTISDPADAETIASATFVEVWSLARFHATSDTDVYSWVRDIAARRAADRRPVVDVCSQVDAPEDRPKAPGTRSWWAAVAARHERYPDLVLAALLARPADVAVDRQTARAGRDDAHHDAARGSVN